MFAGCCVGVQVEYAAKRKESCKLEVCLRPLQFLKGSGKEMLIDGSMGFKECRNARLWFSPPLFGLSLAALSMDPLPTLLAFSIQTTDRRDPHYPPGRGGGFFPPSLRDPEVSKPRQNYKATLAKLQSQLQNMVLRIPTYI